jgi:hypothetical protein
MRGSQSGNYGSYNRHWGKAADGDEVPGHGFLYKTGAAGEDSVNLWAQNEENGQGVMGWDRTQLVTIATAHAAADPVPYFLFAENGGMLFQGQVADTNGNWNAGAPIDAGATGTFETGDYANRIYTYSAYYIADTAAAAQLLVMRVAGGGHGG